MVILLFPSLDFVQLALQSRAVLRRVWQGAVEMCALPDGEVQLRFVENLDLDSWHRLNSLGVRTAAQAVGEWRHVSCWPALLPAQKHVPIEGKAIILALAADRAASMLARLRKWHKESTSFAWSNDTLLVRVTELPFHLLQQVEAGEIPAYHEWAPQVWIKAGWSHPFVSELEIPKGKCLIIDPAVPWRWEALPEWQREEAELDLHSPPRSDYVSRPDTGRLPLPQQWKLLPTTQRPQAALWILERNAIPRLQALVRGMNDRALTRFRIALVRGKEPIVLLKSITGRKPPLLFEMDGEFCSVLKIPNLYLPVGCRLHPPSRRDIIRNHFAADGSKIYWLEPGEKGSLHIRSIPLATFRPLSERTAHQAPKTRAKICWTRSGWGDFERYIVRLPTRTVLHEDFPVKENEPRSVPTAPLTRLWSKLLGWLRTTPPPPELPVAEALPVLRLDDAVHVALEVAKSQPPSASPRLDEAEDRCRALEIGFLEELGKGSADEAASKWSDLAGAYHILGRHADAAICWLNSIWEQATPAQMEVWGWLRSEATLARLEPKALNFKDWLHGPSSPALTRAIAASVVWGAMQKPLAKTLRNSLGDLQTYLQEHEADLSLRTVWLTRLALTRLSGGDVLALARSADRLQGRLDQSGLSLENDAPAFLRWAQTGLSGPFHEVRHWLSTRRGLIQKWITERTTGGDPGNSVDLQAVGLRAESTNTCAYSDLMMAWGLARLGEHGESDRLSAQACKALPADSAVHSLLVKAFRFRIQQAQEGKNASNPLPDKWQADLDRVGTRSPTQSARRRSQRPELRPTDPGTARYLIDRLRDRSRILEPIEQVDPFWSSTFRASPEGDPLTRRLLELPGLAGEPLKVRVLKLMNHANGSPQLWPTLLPNILRISNRLLPDVAEEVLEKLPAALEMVASTPALQLPLLRHGLPAAAQWNQVELVDALADRVTLLSATKPGGALLIEHLTMPMLRALHRTGMEEKAAEYWDRIGAEILPEDFSRARAAGVEWSLTLRLTCSIAAGWYAVGNETQGEHLLDEVRKELFTGNLAVRDLTSLALAYAGALGYVPTRQALIRFEELFQRLGDFHVTGSTNTHFTLQPLELIDTMVTGLVQEDFTLGPVVRNWLDDDELRIRRRIRHDLESWLRASGLM